MLAQEVVLQLQKYNFDLLARQEPSGRRRLRYIALAHIKDGKSAAETALALRVTPRAVTRWLKWFVDEGIDRVSGVPHYWSPQRLPKTREQAFRQAVEQLQQQRAGGRVRGEDIRQLLAEPFGVAYTLNGVYELLKRLDMVWISARAVSPNANPARQAEFKKNFAQEVQAVLPPDVPVKQVDVWFQDEMRVGQRGTQTRLWARKGTRPRVVRQQQFESAYLFGAVCAQRDTAVGLVLPYANTQTMALHLQAISLAVPPGRHALLVLDQAGWHTTLKLPSLPNLSLLRLPAGSPELNPAEQVWQLLRDRSLANRCYDNYEQIVDACCEAWNTFTQIPGAIRSLCSRSWACLAPELRNE